MNPAVLLVDDDPNILAAARRRLRRKFEVTTAMSAPEALKVLDESGPFVAVVSDLSMPGSDGVQLLARLSEQHPDTARILLTGNPDVDVAKRAIAEGRVFRFLTKPCPLEDLAGVLTEAAAYYHAKSTERDVLEQTLTQSINVLTEILALVHPDAFDRAKRLRRFVCRVCDAAQIANRWEVEAAAMLSSVGFVTIPHEILLRWRRREALDAAEQRLVDEQAIAGAALVRRIPRMEGVAELVASLAKAHDRADPDEEHLRTLRRILNIATSFVEGVDAVGLESTLKQLRRLAPVVAWTDALAHEYQREQAGRRRTIQVCDLKPGMYLAEPVRSKAGALLLAAGHEVTEVLLARLRSLAKSVGLDEPITVQAGAA